MAVKVCFGTEDSRIPPVYKDKIYGFCDENNINALSIDYIIFPAEDEQVDNVEMLVEDFMMAIPERASACIDIADDIAYIVYNSEENDY